MARAKETHPFYLAATICIRNVDPTHEIEIVKSDYFAGSGKLVRSFVKNPIKLGPLESYSFKIQESDAAGGSGATLLLEWASGSRVFPAVVESVMIGTAGAQGLSFVSPARAREVRP